MVKSISILCLIVFAGLANVGCDQSPETQEEITKNQLEHDQIMQNEQRFDKDEAARKDLLGKGYSPETTEATINTAHAIEDGQKK